jgi:hypothetical protein
MTETDGGDFLGLPVRIVESVTPSGPWYMRRIDMVEELLRIVFNGGAPAVEAAKMLAGIPQGDAIRSDPLESLNLGEQPDDV